MENSTQVSPLAYFLNEPTKGFGSALFLSLGNYDGGGWDYRKVLSDTPLCFTLVGVMDYGKEYPFESVRDRQKNLCDLVLMDGSHSVFKASIDIGMDSKWKEFRCKLRPGYLIIVKKYVWLSQGPPRNKVKGDGKVSCHLETGLMVIHDCTWRLGPFNEHYGGHNRVDEHLVESNASISGSDDGKKECDVSYFDYTYFSDRVLYYCLGRNALLFLYQTATLGKDMVLYYMPARDIMRGRFIPEERARTAFVSVFMAAVRKRGREETASEDSTRKESVGPRKVLKFD